MTLSGNRGEWSEAYCLLRILSEARVQIADSELNPVRNRAFVIEAVMMTQKSSTCTIWIDDDFAVVEDGESIRRADLNSAAEVILEVLSTVQNGQSITIPECEEILAKLRFHRLSASSKTKEDLTLRVLDPFLRTSQLLSFSIKSQLGSPATLLNASKATNFVYSLDVSPRSLALLRLCDGDPNAILSTAIKEGVTITAQGPVDERFRTNLLLIDSRMPELLASLLRLHYESGLSNLSELTDRLALIDPLRLGSELSKTFYRHKIKMFLSDCALGMTPTTPWDGTHSSNGGYLIVSEDGELLCLHSFDRDVFNEYLLRSTKLERGSRKRHEYGSLVDGLHGVQLRLNLQIRFLR